MKMRAASLSLTLLAASTASAAERTPGDAFAIAIERGSLPDVKELVESGESPDTPIEYGEFKVTPLLKAAGSGRRDIVKYLLAQGAKVDGTSHPDGHTALQEAAGSGYDDVVEVLLAAGADVKKKDARGYTALSMALTHLDVAEMLIAKGADPNQTDSYGITPLQTVSSICNPESMRFLVAHGADVNKISQLEYGGQTPLLTAISVAQVECVKTLLELGADPTLKMKSGATALSAAAETQDAEMIALVKAAAAKRPARAAKPAVAKKP